MMLHVWSQSETFASILSTSGDASPMHPQYTYINEWNEYYCWHLKFASLDTVEQALYLVT